METNLAHFGEKRRDLFQSFVPSILALPERKRLTRDDLLTEEFRLYQNNRIAMYYAPFDYINKSAKIALVGITPGWTQMEIAYRSVRHDLGSGLTREEACRRAKSQASFAGSMRRNLVSMLNDLKVPEYLGIEFAESLFAEHYSLVHTTSAIRYPVFVKGRNYTGHGPKLLRTTALEYFVENILVSELEQLRDALVIPLGKAVTEVLDYLSGKGQLDRSRCLLGFPHPSGANGHRVRQLTERKEILHRQLEEWAKDASL